MQIIKAYENIPKIKSSVISIGNFDGVHLGHQSLIRKIVEESKSILATPVLITFDPHPLRVLFPEKNLQGICSFSEMTKILGKLGIELLLSIPFTKEFSLMPPVDFLEKLIIPSLQPATIYVGYDHRFGRDRDGDIDLLKQVGTRRDIKIRVVLPVKVNNQIISSSTIRDAIANGNLSLATAMLGRFFRLTGEVVAGDGRGKSLGFPTANIIPEDRVLPPDGVYATQTIVDEEAHPSVTYIGKSPTFGGSITRVETHLFEWQDPLYGKMTGIDFLEQIRPDMKFRNKQELIRQMELDCHSARRICQKSSR